jgi:hypothetical protein
MERSSRDTSRRLDTSQILSQSTEAGMLPYVWSYGMGAESTAAIRRMLTDHDARSTAIAPDFSNLVIVIAQDLLVRRSYSVST